MDGIQRLDSIAEIHSLLGKEGHSHPLVSVLHCGEEWKEIEFANKKFSIGLYQINLKGCGEGSIQYGRNLYDFQDGTMVFSAPGQVMEFDKVEKVSKHPGWKLFFHPDLIRSSELGKAIENYAFFHYHTNEALHLSTNERECLTEIVNKIEIETSKVYDKHSQGLIIANIKLLLNYCKRFYDRQFSTRSGPNQDLLTSFNLALRDYYSSEKPLNNGPMTVKNCAEMLSVSSNYLSDMIKSETGITAKESINNYVIERAKNSLLGSNLSIAEVAYGLGFGYPQGLNKFFKKMTGLSPTAFRKAHQLRSTA